jgi:hypothetical protein
MFDALEQPEHRRIRAPDERRRLARMVEGPDVTPGERMRGRLVEPEVPVYLEPAFAQPRLF